jgi:hypothetical protein
MQTNSSFRPWNDKRFCGVILYSRVMDSTSLNLLTINGVVSVTFTPPLESAQYGELYELTREVETDTELVQALRVAADRWDRKIKINR